MSLKSTSYVVTSVVGAVALTLISCATAPRSLEGRAQLREDSSAALSKAMHYDPSMSGLCEDAPAYAVFPKVGKGAAGVGGAYGKGVLFENGRIAGYCDLTQASIGLQLGGQTYTEIVCFQDQAAINKFKAGDLAFDAQVTAVALKSGAGANAKYTDGVAVFTMDESGLMFEAAVGGQKFSYQSL